MDVILGIIFGALSTFFAIKFIKIKMNKDTAEKQSVILIEKIKNVCKLVTVEGDFSEIYHYQDVKERFMSLISSKKKAIILVNAKAFIGYDLKKIKLTSNPKSKTILITNFPKAEVLTVDTILKYYDKTEGYFNKFEAEDLTTLNEDSRQFILDKIPESGLMESANREMIESIGIIKNIVETIGWKLDYTALEVPLEQQKFIE